MGLLDKLFGKRSQPTGMPDEGSPLWARGALSPTLLSEWRWLVKDGFDPVWCTACGDLFLQKTDGGAVYLLESATGSLLAAAKSAEALDEAARDHFDAWWKPGLVAAAEQRLRKLEADECYSWLVPPRLGGKSRPDNLTIRDLPTHFATLGQSFKR